MIFENLKLTEPVLRALQDEGYITPTPIQAKAIPCVLDGKDLLGCAQTGTGKTAAFSIPIIQNLLAEAGGNGRKSIRALILTPIRELAAQIGDNINAYSRHTRLKHTVIFGGVSQKPQVEALRKGVDILVATPGRLLDLINQKIIDLQTIRFFVLDEADRMLDMGFIHDIKKILLLLPRKRQSLFFSATMPAEIEKLSRQILNHPVMIEVTPPSSTVEVIEQHVYRVEKTDKSKLLVHLLQDKAIESVLVFTRTKHGADKVARILGKSGIKAEAIHGNKSQNARVKAMNNFRDRTTRVLIATDIAARGIDIDHLSHVINYDLPNIPETYVHRIGRTGRAGRSGVAFSFCDSEEKVYLKDIERLIGRHIAEIQEHPFNTGVVRAVPVFSEKEELKKTVRREDRKSSRNSRFQNGFRNRSDVRA
ncbi:DEAD/DEAH box helicase [Coprobacter sp.]|uniref:DEAD/DEAH box helicase n=1 Tax=Coprobacter sp. TaxID=1941478 RepID=UPI003AB19FBE